MTSFLVVNLPPTSKGKSGETDRHQLAKLVEAPRCNPLQMLHKRQLSVDCHSKTRDVMGRCNPVAIKQNLRHSDISELLT